jgi:hypothetical protein
VGSNPTPSASRPRLPPPLEIAPVSDTVPRIAQATGGVSNMKMRLLSLIVPALLAGAAMSAHAQEGQALSPAKFSVETTPVGDIVKNEQAKAVLEAALPAITQFYDQIATMTLSQVAPMSQGAIDDAKLKEIQAAFDKIG